MTTNLTLSTNYQTAANWLKNSFILCNDICNIDESVYDEMRFGTDEDGNTIEIFQWYLTDCSLSDVEFLEQHFELLFSYSDKLNLYILCVNHYGTSWDYVPCCTDLQAAVRGLGE